MIVSLQQGCREYKKRVHDKQNACHWNRQNDEYATHSPTFSQVRRTMQSSSL